MATDVLDGNKFYLQKEQIIQDLDEDYEYEEVPVDDDIEVEEEEDLDAAVRAIQEKSQDEESKIRKESIARKELSHRPELIDDFMRNFLVKMGMMRTFDCFQTEWYELQQKGLLNEEDVDVVPDIYIRNQQLDNEVKFLRTERDRFKDAAVKTKDMYVKLRKDRDFHRMHHKRVVQEKNKLVTDIKRIKKHYSSYEPALQQLKNKYEVAMKEKMLTKLERDRAVGQVVGLQSTIKSISTGGSSPAKEHTGMTSMSFHSCQKGQEMFVDKDGRGPSQRALAAARSYSNTSKYFFEEGKRHPNDAEFPIDTRVNPLLSQIKAPPGHLTRTGGFRLSNTFQAHSLAVSGVALHPKKQILCTTSDDNSWKMWAVPSGDIIMTGEGHSDWVSSCDFHPSGTRLATTSGDTTVKIWDFGKAKCIHTFTDHTHAVWSSSWHTCGDFLATASMDNSSKIWDLNSLRCRYTLRGHADSVNSIQFLPFSNILCTSSADKTLSLWDARTGLCAQTFYGHMHSVNSATFNLKGDTIASCDSYGVVKLWDIRTVSPMSSIDVGPHPANQVTFDPSAAVLAICSNDGTIKMYELATGQVTCLVGHEDAVQASVFDKSGEFMVSGGSDYTVRVWS
ncbi:sperm-associated antigen 16 protein-like [Tubulanus polymorphus]|uniref:sperm-associated antigen 16 protein-like n=1 Tax=Tubulanus polymorphus TaxID=672921 RepID=UPI003DA5F610